MALDPSKPGTQISELRRLHDTLKLVDFLDQLKVDQLDALLAAMRKRRYKPGETVFKQGDPGDALYLIAAGRLSMSVRRGLLNRKAGYLGEGEYFGEGALLSDQPRAATFVAETACDLYLLHKEDFKSILLANPGIAQALRVHQVKARERRAKA